MQHYILAWKDKLKIPVVATSRSAWMAGSERDLEWLIAPGNDVLLVVVLPLVNPFFLFRWPPELTPSPPPPGGAPFAAPVTPPSTTSSEEATTDVPFWACCWGCCPDLFRLLEIVVFLRPTTKVSLSLFCKKEKSEISYKTEQIKPRYIATKCIRRSFYTVSAVFQRCKQVVLCHLWNLILNDSRR